MDPRGLIGQGLFDRLAGAVCFTRTELDRAIDAALEQKVGDILIADELYVDPNSPIELGTLTGPVTIACTNRGRLVSDGGVLFKLSGQGDGAGNGGLRNRLTLRHLNVGAYDADGDPDFNYAPSDVVLLKDEALDFYISVLGGTIYTGSSSTPGSLINCPSTSPVIRRSRIEGIDVCWAGLSGHFIRSSINDNNFESKASITISDGSYNLVSRNQEVKGITLASGVSHCIVDANLGDRGVTALSATTSDGNTVTGNRKFLSYPTPGGTDVVTDNA